MRPLPLVLTVVLLAGCLRAPAPAEPLGTVASLAATAQAPIELLAATDRGLFRSPDGASWARAGPAREGLAAVVPHPVLAGVVWVGGEAGVQISDDGGLRFQTAGLAGIAVRALAASPTRPEQLWASTAAGQLYRSEDSGESWALLGQPPAIRALAPSAADPHTLLAATEAGLLRSRDAGASWSKLGDLELLGLAVDPRDHRVLLAANGTAVFRSADAGQTWFALPAPPLSGTVAHVALDPIEPRRMWAATREGAVAGSADGGGSWSRLRG